MKGPREKSFLGKINTIMSFTLLTNFYNYQSLLYYYCFTATIHCALLGLPAVFTTYLYIKKDMFKATATKYYYYEYSSKIHKTIVQEADGFLYSEAGLFQMFFPSFELFLCSGLYCSILVFDWSVHLLILSCEFLCCVIELFHISFPCSAASASFCHIVNVVLFVPLLHSSPACELSHT